MKSLRIYCLSLLLIFSFTQETLGQWQITPECPTFNCYTFDQVEEAPNGLIVYTFSVSNLINFSVLNVALPKPDGNVFWSRSLRDNTRIAASTITTEDYIYVIGQTENPLYDQDSLAVAKYDYSGNLIWDKAINSGTSYSQVGVELDNGNIIISSLDELNTNSRRTRLSIISGDGDLIESILFKGEEIITIRDISKSNHGTIYLAGSVGLDGRIWEITEDLEILNEWRYDNIEDDWSSAITSIKVNANHIWVSQFAYQSSISTISRILKLDFEGNVLGTHSFDEDYRIYEITDITINDNDQVNFIGRGVKENTPSSVIGKIDDNGHVAWNREFIYDGTDVESYGSSIANSQFGGHYILGYFDDLTHLKVYLARLNEDGFTNTNDIEFESDLVLYPNPAHHYIYYKTSLDIKKISIYDSNMQLIKDHEEVNKSLDISELENGFYWISFTTEDNTYFKKVVKVF